MVRPVFEYEYEYEYEHDEAGRRLFAHTTAAGGGLRR